MKAIILKADGSSPFVKDISQGLTALNAEVGGTITGIYSTQFQGEVLVFGNDDGIPLGLPVNRNMLAIRQLHLASPTYRGDLLVTGIDGEGAGDVPQKFIDLLVAPSGE